MADAILDSFLDRWSLGDHLLDSRPRYPAPRLRNHRTLPETGHDLSFGLEFEFLVFYKTDESERVARPPAWALSREDDASFAPPMYRIQKNQTVPPPPRESFARRAVRRRLRELGFCVDGLPRPEGTADPFPGMYLLPQSGWVVGGDVTVREPQASGMDAYFPGYEWCGMEVRTPPLRDCAEAYDHVRAVIHAIITNFRVRVNPTCGFHCHVGSGFHVVRDLRGNDMHYQARAFSLRALKRIGSLLWAADGFLCYLHPPERAHSAWAPPLRRHAVAAHRRQSEESDYIPGPEHARGEGLPLYSESPFPALRPHPDTITDETRRRLETCGWRVPAVITTGEDEPINTRVLDGWRLLETCASTADVARLLSHARGSGRRLAYHFADYLGPSRIDEFGRVCPFRDKGTIEFREAAGTMDPEWAATWAGICVGLVSFARHSRRRAFRRVLLRLAEAEEAALTEEGGNQYDVIRLLHDVGLFDEADFVEWRLKAENRERHWYPCRLRYPLRHVPDGAAEFLRSEAARARSGRDGVAKLMGLVGGTEPEDYVSPFVKPGPSLREMAAEEYQMLWRPTHGHPLASRVRVL